MILRNKLVFSVILLFVVSSASVFAGTFEFIDTTSEVQGSTFTLTLDPAAGPAGQHWTVTLDVDTVAHSGWFINYVTLHLDGGQSPTVGSLMFNGSNHPPNWNVVEGGSNMELLKRQHFPQNSWIGLYTDEIEVSGSGDPSNGVALNADGVTDSWIFDIWLAPGSILNESPSIQVGYFNYDKNGRGGRGKLFFTQMSQSVPEPSTLILLLSGTGILAGAARLRRKMK